MKWNKLQALLLLPLLLTLSSCTSFSLFGRKPPVAPEPIVVTETEYLYREIPIQARPKPVTLYDIQFYAVTDENIDDFLYTFEEKEGSVVFFAISVPDYENIALNMGELRRFIESQNAIILYYEENVNVKPEQEDDEEN